MLDRVRQEWSSEQSLLFDSHLAQHLIRLLLPVSNMFIVIQLFGRAPKLGFRDMNTKPECFKPKIWFGFHNSHVFITASNNRFGKNLNNIDVFVLVFFPQNNDNLNKQIQTLV